MTYSSGSAGRGSSVTFSTTGVALVIINGGASASTSSQLLARKPQFIAIVIVPDDMLALAVQELHTIAREGMDSVSFCATCQA